jgi:hypothetical protein
MSMLPRKSGTNILCVDACPGQTVNDHFLPELHEKWQNTGLCRSPCGTLLFRHAVKNDESYWGSTMPSLLPV